MIFFILRCFSIWHQRLRGFWGVLGLLLLIMCEASQQEIIVSVGEASNRLTPSNFLFLFYSLLCYRQDNGACSCVWKMQSCNFLSTDSCTVNVY